MFAPLRCHGHHALLTGVGSPATWLQLASARGLPALALPELDGLAGLVEFLQAASELPRERSVRPLVACELSDGGGRPGRVLALVESERGYAHLCRLITRRRLGHDPGETEGAPDDFDLVQELAAHQEGLLLLADHPRLLLGLTGRVEPRRLLALLSPAAPGLHGLRDPRDTPRRNTHRGRATVPAATVPAAERPAEAHMGEPPDQAFLDSPKTPPPAPPIPARVLLDAARATGAALVLCPDAWYPRSADAPAHAVRVAIKHGALLDDLPPEWLATEPAHLPELDELIAACEQLPDVPGAWPLDDTLRAQVETEFPGLPPSWRELPAPLARTLALASSCHYTPPLGGVLFPEVDLPEDETPYSRLCSLALEGAQRRYRPLRPEVLRRLDHELSTIQQLGFAPYFLLVHGLGRFAKEQGIPCVGRGSAADSLVAYCLELTDADPFRYGLPFERFLNPARRDRPDIDLDFCWRRRDEILEHVFELFGAERTAMICTLNSFGMRAAFREVALALGVPPAELNPWSSRLPGHWGPAAEGVEVGAGTDPEEAAPSSTKDPSDVLAHNPLAKALRASPEARHFPFDDPRLQRVLELAAGLLDTPRHFGLHPGGVVVAPGCISDLVPCQPSSKGPVVTQLDKDAVEAIGLVKMDLLGNRALTTLDDCLGLLRARGLEVDLEAVPEDDPLTAEALARGDTLACFQIESPGMRHLLQQTGAHRMDDVIQAVALIRPGPASSGMKDAYVRRFRGLEEPTPPHPRVTDLLWETHGVMLYQEDVMQVAARVAGLDLAEADQLRRALQKRRFDELADLRQRFRDGALREGLTEEETDSLWDRLAGFASFAFCKAHAVTYGRLAYRAAWLKTHHPAAFLTAFLLSETGYYPTRVYVEEARRKGVRILGPDVNRSGRGFTLEHGGGLPALRIGLERARGLSGQTVDSILEARQLDGPFLSLPDFLDRTRARRDEAATLIRTGAFDAFDRTRPELLWRLHLLCTPKVKAPRDAALDARALASCDDPRRALAGWSSGGLGVRGEGLQPGQTASLFPAPAPEAVVLPGIPGPDARERGREEFQLLGLTLEAHPTELFPCPGEDRARATSGRGPGPATGSFHSSSEEGVRPVNPCPCAGLRERIGARVTLRGWPAATRLTRTDQGERMRFLTLEDPSGLAEVILFPDVYRRDGHRLDLDSVVLVTGVVEDQYGACTLRVERLW